MHPLSNIEDSFLNKVENERKKRFYTIKIQKKINKKKKRKKLFLSRNQALINKTFIK